MTYEKGKAGTSRRARRLAFTSRFSREGFVAGTSIRGWFPLTVPVEWILAGSRVQLRQGSFRVDTKKIYQLFVGLSTVNSEGKVICEGVAADAILDRYLRKAIRFTGAVSPKRTTLLFPRPGGCMPHQDDPLVPLLWKHP